MSNKVAVRVTGGLLVTASLALVALVATSPHRFLYDEPFFVHYVPLIHQYGLTAKFMNSLTGTAGPLYAFVHVAFEPLTKLRPVWMRFVNLILLAMVAGLLAACLKLQGSPDYGLASCSVLIVPMTWVVAGMALSEMPAMVFVTLSLYLQLRGLEALRWGRPIWQWFLASGVFLGIAVWGRQPYLVLIGAPVLIAALDRRLRISVLIFSAVLLAFAIPLFLIWKGLVPPSHHFVQQGISLNHGLISLSYTGICFLLLAPRFGMLPAKTLIGLVGVTVAANAWLALFVLYPIQSVVDRYLSVDAVSIYGNACGSLLLSCGVVFLAVLLRDLWESRDDLKRVTINCGLLCVAASPLFIAHEYSSRYTAMSLPYLILAAQPWREWRLKTVAAALVGCGAGFFSLHGYFSQ